jgi:C-terminal processing protease CtpA/Prc
VCVRARVGGAAEMTGLFHAGDSEITSVDGISLEDKTLQDAKELFQGPEGTMCRLGCVYGVRG